MSVCYRPVVGVSVFLAVMDTKFSDSVVVNNTLLEFTDHLTERYIFKFPDSLTELDAKCFCENLCPQPLPMPLQQHVFYMKHYFWNYIFVLTAVKRINVHSMSTNEWVCIMQGLCSITSWSPLASWLDIFIPSCSRALL